MSSGLRISSSIGVNPLGAEPRPKNATIQLLEGYGDDDQRTEMATLAPFVADTAGTDEGGTVNTAHKNWTLEVNTPVIYERKMTVSRKLRHDSFIAW